MTEVNLTLLSIDDLLRCPRDRNSGPHGRHFRATVRDGLYRVVKLSERHWRRAASASCASWVIYAKNAADWPMNSPIFVKNSRVFMATCCVLVGRMIEQRGRFELKNGHGSGMIRFFFSSWLGTSRSGKVTETPVTGSTAVKAGALPALSDHV